MHTISSAAARLARLVPAAEAAIDEALLQVAGVLHTTVAARRDTGVAAVIAQPAIIRLHKTLGDLIGAQNEMLRAHGQLRDAGREVGVGDEQDCPPMAALEEAGQRAA